MINSVRRARSRLEASALTAGAACFALFSVNVLFGWSARMMGWDASWRLERAPEFLLLFSSAISFAVASLAAERRNQPRTPHEPPSG